MNTIIIAQILGIFFTVTGLAVLINKKSTAALIEETAKNHGFWMFSGLITLALGSILVCLNNTWGSGLQSLVSLIGWLVLLKAIFMLLFPNSAMHFYRKWNKSGLLAFCGFVAFILGLVLLYKGLV